MDEYLIGAGAVLTAGPAASVAMATLHAQTTEALPAGVTAAMIDFEAPNPRELSRVVIVAAGWQRRRFESAVLGPLLARRECTLVDVLDELARATEAAEVHLFARWLPDGEMLAALAERGVRVLAHPLDSIGQAALISGQRVSRWCSPFRAA